MNGVAGEVVDPKRIRPDRPGLPPLLCGGLAFWVGVAFGLVAWVPVLAFVLLTFACVVFQRWRQGFVCVVASLFLLLGCVCAFLDENRLVQQRDILLSESSVSDCPATLLSDSFKGSYGSQCLASFDRDNATYKVLLSFQNDNQVLCGERLRISGRLSVPEDASFLDSKGALAKLSVDESSRIESVGFIGLVSSLRAYVISRVAAACDGVIRFVDSLAAELSVSLPFELEEIKDVLLALTCGFRPSLSDDQVYADFKAAGLAHLVAVSGAHLALVSGVVSSLLERMGLSRRGSVAALVVMLGSYVVMVGMPISCVRAVVMALLSSFSFVGGRRSSSLSALGVVMVFFVTTDPSCSSSMSFQLSVLATLGISLFAPWISWWCSGVERLPKVVKDSLSVTLSATVPTLPVTIVAFSQLPLVSPLSNLLAGPLLGLIMPLCLVCYLGCLFGPVLLIPVVISFLLISALVLGVKLMLLLPFACVPMLANPVFTYVAGVVLCCAWWVFWPVPTRKGKVLLSFFALLLALDVFWPFANPWKGLEDRLVMLDVGQGDAFLLQSQGKSLLVDTGRNDKLLLSGLASEGVTHLDAVLVSHCDDDHYGSLDSLEGIIGVDKVLVAKGTDQLENAKAQSICRTSRALTGALPQELSTSDVLSFGSYRVEVVSPDAVKDGGNQDSLVFKVKVLEGSNSWSILMAGDAETECLEPLAQAGKLDDVDVLKVSHHGSKAGVSDDLLDVLKPELSLISVGEGNRYGHPTQEALDKLEDCGSRVYRSDKDGKVTCVFSPGAISVSTVG